MYAVVRRLAGGTGALVIGTKYREAEAWTPIILAWPRRCQITTGGPPYPWACLRYFTPIIHSTGRCSYVTPHLMNKVKVVPYLINKSRDWSSTRCEAKASGWLQSAVTKSDVLSVVVECNGRHSFRGPV